MAGVGMIVLACCAVLVAVVLVGVSLMSMGGLSYLLPFTVVALLLLALSGWLVKHSWRIMTQPRGAG